MSGLWEPITGEASAMAYRDDMSARGWGVKRPCLGCGRDCYSAGGHCLGCEAGIEGWSRSVAEPAIGFTPRAAVESIEHSELVPPEFVCEANRCEHGLPKPVLDLWDACNRAGWRAVTQHSRGGVMGGTGKQLAVADVWSVRFRRDGWMGYAVRRGAAWDSVCVAGETLPPFMKLTITSLRDWLAEPARPESWYAEIVNAEAAAKLASKIVACPGRGQCMWVDGDRGDHTHRGNGDVKPRTARKQAEHGG